MSAKRKILIVEDDLSILMGLQDNLEGEGYEVETAGNGEDGYEMASSGDYDLLILDVMLPGMNGFEICKKIKGEKPLVPVIMLTARGTEMDKVAGLDYGADDYMTKPFSLSELLARVRAILRRAYPETKALKELTIGRIHMDFERMKAASDGADIHFTKTEFAIMQYFAEHAGEVIHRHDLLNKVWGYDKTPSTRTVDNFILELRKKIEWKPSEPKHILSISGVGYRFVPDATRK